MEKEERITLKETVESLYSALGGEESEYVSVIVMVLVGAEEEVVEAEIDISNNLLQDNLACRSAKITLSDWIIEEKSSAEEEGG
jgi:hypothetical protein